MTQEEFVAILGDEWMVGRGKVDWFSYWPGKVSQQSVVFFLSLIAPQVLTLRLSQPVKAITAITRIPSCH
jgi:hypothetical protein